MVPAPSVKVPRVSTYSGSRLPASVFAYGAFTLSGWSSQGHSANFCSGFVRSEPHGARAMVWALPVSLAATPGITVVFSSSGYLDVSVRRVPLHALCVGAWIRRVPLRGFPHSDTCGSQGICPSPQLFAACRVFHRPAVPRHPPCALPCLTICARLAWRAGHFFGFPACGSHRIAGAPLPPCHCTASAPAPLFCFFYFRLV